jgi:hypothetical protein
MVRFGLRVAVGLGLLLLALVLGAPLVLRGPRLARLVENLLPAMCGRVHADGISLGTFAIVQGLTGHSFPIEIDGLVVDDPSGRRVLSLQRTTARLRVTRDPRRLTVADLRVGPGTWKMLADRRGGVSLLAAFAPADSCGGARPPRRHGGGGGPSAQLLLERVELVDLDITFDFSAWALTFAHASAVGRMDVGPGPDGNARLSFDVRDVRAGPGSGLRVGSPRDAWVAEVPFDAVELARAAAPLDHPTDLVLEVSHAKTGRSDLGGTAVFRSILGRGPVAPGLDVDAHWQHLADAATRLRARWRPVIARVMGTEQLDLGASLHGPFSGMAARLNTRAPHVQLDLSLAPDLTAKAQLVLDRADTAAHLPPSLQPLLGGIVSGRLGLEVRLATKLARVTGSLAEMDLRLDRARGGPAPVHWRLRKGPAGTPDSTAPQGGASSLELSLASAELREGALALRGLSAIVRPRMGSLAGDATLTLVDPDTGQQLANPLLDTSLRFEGLGIGILREADVKGTLSGSVTLQGSSDDLRMALRFGGTRQLTLTGLTITLPAVARARLQHGDFITIPPTHFQGPEGAELEAHGTLIPDQRIDASVSGRNWPLAATPLRRLVSDPARGWKGTFDGTLHLTGEPATPDVSGRIDLHDVAAAGLPLGSGEITFSRQREDVRFDGQLGEHLRASGHGRLVRQGRFDINAQVSALVLDPWLHSLSPKAGASVTGDFEMEVRPGRPFVADARFSDIRARWGPALALANQGPVHVHATPGETTLEPCAFVGNGVSVSAQGRLAGQALDAGAHGTVPLALLAGMIPRGPVRLAHAAGEVAVDLQARGPVTGLTIETTASIGAPQAAVLLTPGRPAVPVSIGPVAATLEVPPASPPRVRVERLRLAAAGATVDVSGAAALDTRDLAASTGTLDATALLDGATLARQAPALLDRAEGRLTLRARLDGAFRAPAWRATLDGAGLVVVPRKAGTALSVPSLRASLEGDRLTLAPFEVALLPEHAGPAGHASAAPLSSGRITIGAPGRPGSVEIKSLDPLDIGRVDVALAGSGVSLPGSLTGAPITGAAFDLRLAGPNPLGWLVLGGTVTVPRAGLNPKAIAKKEGAPSTSSGKSTVGRLLKRVWLDLRVRVGDLGVEAPGPNLSLQADCRIDGPLLKPKTSGSVRGLDLYSRAALFVADAFFGLHAAECRQ